MGAININDREHDAVSDFSVVHDRLSSKILLKNGATTDSMRAAEMEKYLRAIKAASNSKGNVKRSSAIAESFEDLAYEDLVSIAEDSLKIMNKSRKSKTTSVAALFNREHSHQDSKRTSLEVDDVFEEEFYAVLQAVADKATNGKGYELGASLTGGQLAITKNFANMTDDLIKEYMNELYQGLLKHNYTEEEAQTELAKMNLKPKSGKVDVTGFNLNFTGRLDEKWEKMVQAFSGASFTLKNYTSRADVMEIHLGQTVPFKAISGALDDLGFNDNEATHIFFHGKNSYRKHGTPELGTHAYHTRLYYELTGAGLYDEEGNPIDAADFLIYNDPYTNDIFVRSTKQIIYDLISKEVAFKGDPFNSAITIRKSYFI